MATARRKKKGRGKGQERTYIVTLKSIQYHEITVKATSRKEAIRKAWDDEDVIDSVAGGYEQTLSGAKAEVMED